MKNKTTFLLVILLFVLIKPLNAQDHKEHKEESKHEELYKHSLGLFVGYTFIPNTLSSGENETFVAPTIGLDYTYKFNHKIALGVQNEFELASYEIEREHNEETLKREYAYVTALVFIYEPVEWWSVFAGPGFEFEPHENFFVSRLGTEFIKKFEDGWSIALTFIVDFKKLNTTPALGITIMKGLGKPK